MSNLVVVSGDFCSGSTLVYTLFRKSEQYCCLYEPMHQRLREYLQFRVQPDEGDHHFFMDDYYRELRPFDRIPALFDPSWGASDLFVPPDADRADLYRYLSYIIGMGFGRSPRVMFKENRLAFRLAWFRKNFPHAKIVHIYRKKEAQWKSMVRRGQTFLDREDVGQHGVDFSGFNVAPFCEDLKTTFPELDAKHFKTGFERFSTLWELSNEHNRRSADISIAYEDLIGDFEPTFERMWKAVGAPPVDAAALKQFVVRPESHSTAVRSRVARRMSAAVQRALWTYARARVRLQPGRYEAR